MLPLIGKTEYQNIKIDTFCVDKVRAIKTDEEIRNMREAAKIVDKCAENARIFTRGISEQELGDKIIHMLKDLGLIRIHGKSFNRFGKIQEIRIIAQILHV